MVQLSGLLETLREAWAQANHYTEWFMLLASFNPYNNAMKVGTSFTSKWRVEIWNQTLLMQPKFFTLGFGVRQTHVQIHLCPRSPFNFPTPWFPQNWDNITLIGCVSLLSFGGSQRNHHLAQLFPTSQMWTLQRTHWCRTWPWTLGPSTQQPMESCG